MPSFTPYFGLQYFLLGDLYSASIDKSRFTAIDSYFAFIADVIGDGVIDGWSMVVSNNLVLEIKPGWGMINRKIVQTYGSYYRTLSNNTNYYVWMRDRIGIVSEVSGFSDIAKISHQQTDVVASPTNLRLSRSTFSFVSLRWDSVTSDYVVFYEIYRSTNNIDFVLLNKVSASEFIDQAVIEDTIYYYKIRAIANSVPSAYATPLLVVTPKNLTKPSNVTNIGTRISDKIIHITWDSSVSKNVANIYIVYQPVNKEQIAIGSAVSIVLDRLSTEYSLTDLLNSQLYRIKIYTESYAKQLSEIVVLYNTPRVDDGPQDITSLSVTDFKSSTSYKNVLNIVWNTYSDPYMSFDGRSEIIIEENLPQQVTVSDPIVVEYDIATTNIEVFSYTLSGQKLLKNILPRATYFVTVRNIDDSGKKSVGKRIKYKTRNFKPPLPPSNITFASKIVNESLSTTSFAIDVAWNNSIDNQPSANRDAVLINNYITITRLRNNQTVTLVDKQNIGVRNRYTIASEFVINDSKYTVSLVAKDEFNNESTVVSATYDFLIDILASAPNEPTFSATSGNKQVVVTWALPTAQTITFVNIYRSNIAGDEIAASAYELIATVPALDYSFIDYNVYNDVIYSYFVSAVNELGLESPNLINDPGSAQIFIRARPTDNSSLRTPDNLIATKISTNVELIWDATGGIFDGYEIFRSNGNKYSFESIATVSSSTTYYLDTNVLNRSKDVYYMIRKYRNESEPYLVVGPSVVADAILLGYIQIVNGSATIDTEPARIIKNLLDPITIETNKQLAEHKHDFVLSDKRIDLSPKIAFTTWFTRDNQSFYSNDDLSIVENYSIEVAGIPIEDTGLLFVFDKELATITFERKLAPIGNEIEAQSFPYASLPSISLIVDGLEEVQNRLDPANIVGFSASQVSSGVLAKEQIEKINHRGRINEQLIPQQVLMKTVDDGYRFTFVDLQQNFGTATVFYDILGINNNSVLIAASSSGILRSNNFGQTWEIVTQFTTSCSKLYFAEKYNTILAATNSGVYAANINDDFTFQAWTEVYGTENTKIIRDFTADDVGDVYCTADLGIYKLRKVVNAANFFFEQLPILGPLSTDGYAIVFDSRYNRLLVSNQLGTFESFDRGGNWFFTNELTEQDPIFMFIELNGYIFAISNNTLYRRTPQGFVFDNILDFTNVEISRKIVIFNNKIYIVTDAGVFVSSPNGNIYTDAKITVEAVFTTIKIQNKVLPIHTLNVIADALLIGTESRLYLSRNGRTAALQYQEENVLCPAIYVNGIEQKIGYRYSSTATIYNKFLSFDVKLDVDDIVTVANQFKIFEAVNGGWTDCNYVAPLTLKVNNQVAARLSVAERPSVLFSTIVYPNLTDRNSNLLTYERAQLAFQNTITELLEEELNEDDEFVRFKNFNTKNIIKAAKQFEIMSSQIYEDARKVTITNADQQESIAPFSFPKMNVLFLSDPQNESQSSLKSVIGTYGTYQSQASTLSSTGNGSFSTELNSDGVASEYISPLPFFGTTNDSLLNKTARKYPSRYVGWRGYQMAFCNAVREVFPVNYAEFDVVGIINSVDGILQLQKEITKYHQLTIDIENVTLDETNLPHYVLEDSFELLNSGLPSHLSQVHGVSVIDAGCTQTVLMDGSMNDVVPPLQAEYIIPNNRQFYDSLFSTIDNKIASSVDNKNLFVSQIQALFFDDISSELLIGTFNSCVRLNINTLEINKVLTDSETNPIIRDIQKFGDNIYALSLDFIYKYDRAAKKFLRQTFANLPRNLNCFAYTVNKNICVGAEDGVYICGFNSTTFNKAVDNVSVDLLYAPDSVFAVLATNEIYASINSGEWRSIDKLDFAITKIFRYRSNNIFATTQGLYTDNTSLSGRAVSLQLMDIFGSTALSSSVSINDVCSANDKLYACLSDGRIVVYDGTFVVINTVFDKAHKIFVYSDKIYLFNGDSFIVYGENKIRRLASGIGI